MERKLKFNIGDKLVYYDSIYEVTGFYTDYNLHYSVKWIAGNSKDRFIIGIPVINDDKFMPYDESIHYDPCKFRPFDKVLVRFDDDDRWEAELFSSYNSRCDNPFNCIGLAYPQCIPYLGNEVLLGTTDHCDKYYCSWDDNKVKY